MQSEQYLAASADARQRADLTFKHNAMQPRHGWLRLTPAYSLKLVNEILRDHPDAINILDPFSGSGTTALCAASLGHSVVSTDINPFLVWFGRAKVAQYSEQEISEASAASALIQKEASKKKLKPVEPPTLANISRWWDSMRLDFLCRIKAGIDIHPFGNLKARNLLLIGFCKTLIALSKVAFNHQSMSFKYENGFNCQQLLWTDESFEAKLFLDNVASVLKSASNNPVGEARVLLCDALVLNEIENERFDLVITSPPYPNRMSYIRELRPYMYWLGYLKSPREAGDLDWQAVGGTWGIATSRLVEWRADSSTFFPNYLGKILSGISESGGKSGKLLSTYVRKYFEDMWKHLVAVRKVLSTGATLHYIVGNSKFYNSVVPTEKIIADMLSESGFREIDIKILRKRNSKKELFEFDVAARS